MILADGGPFGVARCTSASIELLKPLGDLGLEFPELSFGDAILVLEKPKGLANDLAGRSVSPR